MGCLLLLWAAATAAKERPRVKTRVRIVEQVPSSGRLRDLFVYATDTERYDSTGQAVTGEPPLQFATCTTAAGDSTPWYHHQRCVFAAGGGYDDYTVRAQQTTRKFHVTFSRDTVSDRLSYTQSLGRVYKQETYAHGRLRTITYFRSWAYRPPKALHTDRAGVWSVYAWSRFRPVLKMYYWNDSTRTWYLAARSRYNKKGAVVKEAAWRYNPYWKLDVKTITRWTYNRFNLLTSRTDYEPETRALKEKTTYLYTYW